MKKKASALQQVPQAVGKPRQPTQVAVERGRADALEVRRGRRAALAELWRSVQSTAHPRWLGHAIDHHTGTVFA